MKAVYQARFSFVRGRKALTLDLDTTPPREITFFKSLQRIFLFLSLKKHLFDGSFTDLGFFDRCAIPRGNRED